MKTLEKIESLLNDHREKVTLFLIMVVVSLHLLSCESLPDGAQVIETPVDQMQVRATTAIEIPSWIPQDANHKVRYFYLPSIEAYYDSFVGQFVYFNGTEWVYAAKLPTVYAGIDLHTAPLVYLNVGVDQPWRRHVDFVLKYHHFNKPQWHSQKETKCSRFQQLLHPENLKMSTLDLAQIGNNAAS